MLRLSQITRHMQITRQMSSGSCSGRSQLRCTNPGEPLCPEKFVAFFFGFVTGVTIKSVSQ